MDNNMVVVNDKGIRMDTWTQTMTVAETMIHMKHLAALDKLDIIPLSGGEKGILPKNKVRLFHIGCLVYDENENIGEKLSGVFRALTGYDASAVFILRHNGERIDLYMGTACNDPQILSMVFGTFERAVKGNFPGCELTVKNDDDNEEILNDIFDYKDDEPLAVAAVSSMTSGADSPENYIQGIEKLVDGMKGIPFDLVVLASVMSHETLTTMRIGYEQLYTQMVPFHKQSATMSETDTESFSKSMSKSISKSISLTTGTSSGVTHSSGKSYSKGNSREDAGTASKALSVLGLAGGVAAAIMGGPQLGMLGMSIGANAAQNLQTITGTKPRQMTETEGRHDDISQNLSSNKAKVVGVTDGQTDTDTKSVSFAAGKSMGYALENRSIGNILEAIDKHLEHLKLCESSGAYQCAAYLLCGDRSSAQMGASIYRTILSKGEMPDNISYTNVWQNPLHTGMLCEYMKYMKHPCFGFIDPSGIEQVVTPAMVLPASAVPLHFSWPKKPLPGLMVTTHAEFARDVLSGSDDEENIEIGRIYHMGSAENGKVTISSAELRKHLFVSGAPGSGKSNFCYILLDRLAKNGVKFMVIEPAKGEYSSVFGGREDVHVFGTNSLLTPQLSINPFEFPDGVHPLEHLDRIIEVFNASWPMYAAMPALLKEGLEECYRVCGWDLDRGICMVRPKKFPDFKTLLEVLPSVLKNTEYSQEVQGNYIGSLVTRVKSMTNGLCGRIFCSESIDDKVLFDENTIIDISRLGSAETKSLIMGIMIIRLQEYRSTHRSGINEDLKHITLLEEAHHLLRQTSSVQSMEGANLRGMSVEILTNAIAEMRTYGESFVIADQTPSVMSEAVIGNTGTKIIFRLPNRNDRIPVGNAVALNDEQIHEIARLETGIAVMHQNNWFRPVLCKVDYFSPAEYCPLKYTLESAKEKVIDKKEARGTAVRLLFAKKKKSTPPSADQCLSAANILSENVLPSDEILTKVLRNYASGGSLPEWEKESIMSQTLKKAFILAPLLRERDENESMELWGERAVGYFGHQIHVEEDYLYALIGMLILYDREMLDNKSFYMNWIKFVMRQKQLTKMTV